MAWQKQATNSGVVWNARSATTVRWQPDGELPGHVPSAASRLNPVVPSARNPEGSFTFRVRTEFPFYLATGNLAVITSAFTQGGL